eukprot:scaffold9928_cov63-Phaeocystis_antarctica.AAC.3
MRCSLFSTSRGSRPLLRESRTRHTVDEQQHSRLNINLFARAGRGARRARRLERPSHRCPPECYRAPATAVGLRTSRHGWRASSRPPSSGAIASDIAPRVCRRRAAKLKPYRR